MGRYESVRDSFEWQDAWGAFEGTKDGMFNLGHETVGKHATGETRDRFAVRILDMEGRGAEELTYGDLDDLAGRFINFMHDLGLSKGDRVAAMLEASPALYGTVIGCWLGGFEFVPLFNLFGPDATNYRLDDADVKAIVTAEEHRNKIDPDEADSLEYVITVNDDPEPGPLLREFAETETYSSDYEVAQTAPDDPAAIQYTSGTTGAPKGVMIKHRMLVPLYPAFTWAADQRPEDNYFGAAPPAWSYGLYGCTAYPLHTTMGTTSYRGEFNPERFVQALRKYEITNLFAPPTLLRQLSNIPIWDDLNHNIRIVVTAGEPLDPSTVEWVEDTFGSTIVDHYGFTEGSMFINNYAFDDWEIRAGSMGKPAPGYDVRVLDLKDDEEVPQGEIGEIAIRTDAPVTSDTYLNMPEKSEEKWGGEWLRSEDLARMDEDGYFWFEGRADDVILSSGYRIGPTEVENTILDHRAVSEVAVIGLPDQERGEVVSAFIVLDDDYEAGEGLKDEIQQYVKRKLSKHKYPREVHFLEELPRTASDKVQRYKLREEHADSRQTA